jgi:GNAT superfamily N-acetyltransferase
MGVTVRTAAPGDEPRWRALWEGYCRFYEREPAEAVTRRTWARILDEGSPVHAIVAEDADGTVVGIANYVLHDSTATLGSVCYLQDLFVDPAQRANGIGRALIDWLVAEMSARAWSRLYWHTRETNYRARGLYDRYTPHSGFVRYVVTNPRG